MEVRKIDIYNVVRKNQSRLMYNTFRIKPVDTVDIKPVLTRLVKLHVIF